MEDVRHLIRTLGAVTGRTPEAEALLTGMDEAIREVRSRIQGRAPVRVAYVLGGNPPWVAGPNTFIHEMMAAAGGENVFADLDGLYGPISLEELLVRDIDLLLAPVGGEVLLPSDDLVLVRVSPRLELPGPDMAQGVRELARILHPEAFR
jgi:iron complex transport system substrate-binding protein